MKPTKRSSLSLLFLLPALANALTSAPVVGDDGVVEVNYNDRRGVPTKDAPVDGKDGKPHLGPFVETESSGSGDQDLPSLKGHPDDYTIGEDGKKIPKTNDGVMFDKNRDRPQEGTTGTEGGVSAKDKTRKLQESEAGGRMQAQPESPKEAPPMPQSEEEKMRAATKGSYTSEDEDASYAGLDVCLQKRVGWMWLTSDRNQTICQR